METEDFQARNTEYFKRCPTKLSASMNKLRQKCKWLIMEWSKKDWSYEKWFGAWSGQRTSLIPNFKPSFYRSEEIIATKPTFVNKNLSETSSEEHNENDDESERWVWTDLMIANWMILMLKTSRAMMVHLEKFSKLQNLYCKKTESSHTLSWEIRKKIKSSKHRLITWAALTKRCVHFFWITVMIRLFAKHF